MTHRLSGLLLLSTLVLGCSPATRLPTAIRAETSTTRAAETHRAVGPGTEPGHSYPLATGDRWIYSGSSYKWMGRPGSDTTVTRARWTRRDSLTYRVTLGGHEYHRLESYRIEGANVSRRVSYLRQDQNGLFGADATIPPGSETEHLMLPYPTHAGAIWSWPPNAQAIVEGREVVDTPLGRMPAWRVRLSDLGDAAGTVTRMWFGTCGLIGLVSTTDRAYLDADGERVEYRAEYREWLSALNLVEWPPRILGVATASETIGLFGDAPTVEPYVGYYPGPALFDQFPLDPHQVGRVIVADADTDPDFLAVASRLSDGVSDLLQVGMFRGGMGAMAGRTEAQWFDLVGPDFAPAKIRRITLAVDSLSFGTWPNGSPRIRYTFTITVEGTPAGNGVSGSQ